MSEILSMALNEMHRAEKRYEVGRVFGKQEAKQRQLRSILNKLTPQNFEALFEQVLDVTLFDATTVPDFALQIVGRAIGEPIYCEMYAELCFRINGKLPVYFSSDNKMITVKRLVLSECQEIFERGYMAVEEGTIKLCEDERKDDKIKTHIHMLGSIQFIGELFKKKMVLLKVMHYIIDVLLEGYQNPDEKNIEALCLLMTTAGEMLDDQSEGLMDTYFCRMLELSANQKLSSRVRFMVMNAIDLRNNDWQERRKIERPTKIWNMHLAGKRHTQYCPYGLTVISQTQLDYHARVPCVQVVFEEGVLVRRPEHKGRTLFRCIPNHLRYSHAKILDPDHPDRPPSGYGPREHRLSPSNVVEAQINFVPSSQTPLAVLHQAERRYEVGRVFGREDAQQRKLRAILNKLTFQNFKKLLLEVREVNIKHIITLYGFVLQIFYKAISEPTYCEVYANFCSYLVHELPGFHKNDKTVTFKKLLLSECQEKFEIRDRDQSHVKEAEGKHIDSRLYEVDSKVSGFLGRHQRLGNIQFIGELYRVRMLTERIMFSCIQNLLEGHGSPNDEDIEALCKLMSIIGNMIDHPRTKKHLDAYFVIMGQMSTSQKLSHRIRFMLMDVIDLRRNEWQRIRKTEKPNKTEDVWNSSNADQWQCASNFRKAVPRAPTQVMHKAVKKYEVGKVSDEEEAKQRQLKGILNKLTPQNFEKLYAQVKEVNIDNTVTLKGIISQIFNIALTEPTFCEMYASLCFSLAADLPDFTEDNEKVTFKRLLLNKCQEEFERGEREQTEADKAAEEGEIEQSEEEREEKRIKARRRMLGNIRLIGELYKKKMLTERIMHECIKKLLGQYQNHQNPDEEDIEALCKLMSTIGEMIDHAKAKEHMDAYFDMMLQLSTNQKLSSRVRFMLKDAIDLRKNKWQQRRKVEGPKKIEEVHRDAAFERQAQASRSARGPVITSSPRKGAPADYVPRGASGLSSASQQMGGSRGFPSQSRAYGNQDVRFEGRHIYESRTLSVPLPPRPTDDDSITLGPQGGLARGMSIRGQPLVSNAPPLAETPNVGENRRMTLGPNGYHSTPYNSREEVAFRNLPDKTVGTSYDQPTHQDHNTYSGSRDSMTADRSSERPTSFVPTGRVQESTISSRTVTSEAKPLCEDVLKDKSISAIREYYSAKDDEEVTWCIKELNSPSFYPTMISIWVTDSFERKNMERECLAKLLVNLCKSRERLLGQSQLIQGFQFVLSTLEDAVNDAPKAAEFLGQLFAKVILENVVSFADIGRLIQEGGEEPGQLIEIGLASEVLGSTLEFIKSEKGDSVLNEIRASSSLRLEDFRPPHPMKAKKLDIFLQQM